jgi:monosaccharide-transporting ATPase
MIKTLNIKTPNAEKPIDLLSGGNQQKTILARWLAAKPECLFLDEPTRGIDVGAKLEVRRLVRNLAKGGMAFVFTSSELEEIAGTCDRVAILRDRRKVGELEGKDITEDAIMDRISEAHP